MGQYASVFIVPAGKAINKVTNPSKPNWITAHAIASECKSFKLILFYTCTVCHIYNVRI
jgi:hypothetical protein